MPTLNWIGKEAVVNHHHQVPFRLLKDVPELSTGDPGGGNLIVQGDNLVALKALLPYYAGQVKCIYIDPPYNTGNEGWIYNDNVNSPLIKEWLGKAVGKEAEDLSRHDKWLCLMYPRLALLKQFLREDGSIWISMDDSEITSLRALMDEIFGREKFIACNVWQKRYSRENREAIGDVHEYVLVYAMTPGLFKETRNRVPLNEEQAKIYKNLNNDPKGRWRSIPMTAQAGHATPEQFYEIVSPSGKTFRPSEGRCWSLSKATFERLRGEGRIYFGKKGDAQPNVIRYLSEVEGMVPWSWWPHEDVGHTDEASKELLNLFNGATAFDTTPKPTRLLERILQIATNPGDLILDSFAGSGTTGHAVLNLNAESAAKESALNPKGIPPQSPGLAPGAYPGNVAPTFPTPTGLRPVSAPPGHNPVGVESSLSPVSLGSSSLATLGCKTESPWDSKPPSGSASGPGADVPAPRRFILVEMEPHIARDITAERVRRVATGYTSAKGEKVVGLGGGFRFCELGEPLFDEHGQIKTSVRFADLARHVYFTETGEPLPDLTTKNAENTKAAASEKDSLRSLRSFAVNASPFLGECRGVGIYLLFNGILGDKRANGGNILTRGVLAQLPQFAGQKVIYCAGCLLGKDRLQAERIIVRQTPYEIKVS